MQGGGASAGVDLSLQPAQAKLGQVDEFLPTDVEGRRERRSGGPWHGATLSCLREELPGAAQDNASGRQPHPGQRSPERSMAEGGGREGQELDRLGLRLKGGEATPLDLGKIPSEP